MEVKAPSATVGLFRLKFESNSSVNIDESNSWVKQLDIEQFWTNCGRICLTPGNIDLVYLRPYKKGE